MAARILLIDTVYPEFIRWLYTERPELIDLSYEEQMRQSQETCYHNVSVWAEPLREIGYEVFDIWAGHVPLHFTWAREAGRRDLIEEFSDLPFERALIELPKKRHWFLPLVIEQAKAIRPDVIWLSNLYTFDDRFLDAIDGYYSYAVGQNAAMPPETSLAKLKFAVSASKYNMLYFRAKGLQSQILPHGFNTRILRHLEEDPGPPIHDFMFTGNFYPAHSERREALLKLTRELPMSIWTDSKLPASVVESGAIVKKALWGTEMYRTVQKSKAVYNIHLDTTGDWATNQRLYEVTGSGSVLVTDMKSNLADLFDLDRDIVSYSTVDECVEKVKFILKNESARQQIANSGRRRTLTDHTVQQRAQLIDEYLQRYVLN
jgi:spore maturation protein CgeB